MLSVVVPVAAPEPALFDTIAALVPAVADGFVRDLVLAGNAEDAFVVAMADAAGCIVAPAAGDRAARLAAGAEAVRCDWVLVLEPGMVPAAGWGDLAEDFLADGGTGAASFTLVPSRAMPWPVTSWRNAFTTLAGRAHPLQGLIARRDMLAAGRAPGRIVRLPVPILDRRQLGRAPRG